MSLFEHLTDRQTKVYAGIGLALLAGAVLYFAGAGNPQVDSRDAKADPEFLRSTLGHAMETLTQATDLRSCRNALNQLNLYLGRAQDQRPAGLTDEEQRQLQVLDLDEDELAEVGTPTFTLLDGHYLELCFLMRDAAIGLDLPGLPPLEQARAAFGWVMRQVRLANDTVELVPPQFVLRRGWGTPQERALVFLSLVKQLDMEGCLVCWAGESGSEGVQDQLVGVLIGSDIFLFDPRLGMPLPGVGGKGVATLAQLRKDPRIVRQLNVDPQNAYDLTPGQMRTVQVRLTCTLSGIAPRMRYLEQLLSAGNKVNLSDDPAKLLSKFRSAAGAQVAVSFVEARTGDRPSLACLLRRFVPPAEGGVDSTSQLGRFERSLFPWQVLPVLLPDDIAPGAQLREYFAELFEDFPVSEEAVVNQLNRQLALETGPAMQGQRLSSGSLEDWNRRLAFLYLSGAALQIHADHRYLHYMLAAQSPRDQMLRGRLEEAAARLGEGLDQVDYQRRQYDETADLRKRLATWKDGITQSYANLMRLKDAQAHGRAPRDDKALQLAQAQLLASWPIFPVVRLSAVEGPMPLPPWLQIMLRAAADPLGEQGRYLLALCMHEQAEHKQTQTDHAPGKPASADLAAARDAWTAAADKWKAYLDAYPTAPAAATARGLRARALEMLGNRSEAETLLQDLSGLSRAEKVAHLYEAQRLKTGR